MNWNERNQQTVDPVITGARADIDEGLRSYMMKVYNTMGMGLVVTALTSLAVVSIPALYNMIFGTPLFWVVAFAPLAFIWLGFGPRAMMSKTAAQLRTRFYLFAGVFGLSMASLFEMFTGASIVRVFFITSSMFLATSLWGYVTKKDLSGWGSFLFMGLIGIIIASVVNIFIGSSMIHWIVSILGVFIFTGMTAYDTQRIKETYMLSNGAENNAKFAVMGALNLYLNFVILFQNLMMILGQRE